MEKSWAKRNDVGWIRVFLRGKLNDGERSLLGSKNEKGRNALANSNGSLFPPPASSYLSRMLPV